MAFEINGIIQRWLAKIEDDMALAKERADLIGERIGVDFDRRDGALYEGLATDAQKRAYKAALIEKIFARQIAEKEEMEKMHEIDNP